MSQMTNAEIIRYYTKELLSDCQQHNMFEIKNYVEDHVALQIESFPDIKKDIATKRYFTDSMYSGALRELVLKDSLITLVGRGVYQKQEGQSYNDALPNILANTIQKCIEQLADNLSGISYINLNEETVSIITDTTELISLLQQNRITLLSNVEQENENNG